MDAMINGCVLAQAYINEIREATPEGEQWEPKASWLERFGVEVLSRVGISRTRPTPQVEAAVEPESAVCKPVRALVEG